MPNRKRRGRPRKQVNPEVGLPHNVKERVDFHQDAIKKTYFILDTHLSNDPREMVLWHEVHKALCNLTDFYGARGLKVWIH